MEDDFLPPGFDEARFAQVRRAFESALGADRVFFEDLDRTGYKDKFAVNDAAHLPAGAIGPTTVEEVQAALRIAAWTSSTVVGPIAPAGMWRPSAIANLSR